MSFDLILSSLTHFYLHQTKIHGPPLNGPSLSLFRSDHVFQIWEIWVLFWLTADHLVVVLVSDFCLLLFVAVGLKKVSVLNLGFDFSLWAVDVFNLRFNCSLCSTKKEKVSLWDVSLMGIWILGFLVFENWSIGGPCIMSQCNDPISILFFCLWMDKRSILSGILSLQTSTGTFAWIRRKWPDTSLKLQSPIFELWS